jgi:hypothetical protein
MAGFPETVIPPKCLSRNNLALFRLLSALNLGYKGEVNNGQVLKRKNPRCHDAGFSIRREGLHSIELCMPPIYRRKIKGR